VGAIFDGVYELAGNSTEPVTADDNTQTRWEHQELTKVSERESTIWCCPARAPAPIAQLRGAEETDPALTIAADTSVFRPRLLAILCPMLPTAYRLVHLVDVVDVFLINT